MCIHIDEKPRSGRRPALLCRPGLVMSRTPLGAGSHRQRDLSARTPLPQGSSQSGVTASK